MTAFGVVSVLLPFMTSMTAFVVVFSLLWVLTSCNGRGRVQNVSRRGLTGIVTIAIGLYSNGHQIDTSVTAVRAAFVVGSKLGPTLGLAMNATIFGCSKAFHMICKRHYEATTAGGNWTSAKFPDQ